MSLNRFLDVVGKTTSAGEPSPGPLLYGLARMLRPDTIIEVGSWRGHSTLWLARACHENGVGRVYALDNWSLAGGSPQSLIDTLADAGIERYVVPVNGDSLAIDWPPVVNLAFLDGNHGRLYVESEFQRCVQQTVQTIVLHDTTSWWGPRGLLDELRTDGGLRDCYDIAEFPVGDGLTVLQAKAAKPTPRFTEAAYPLGYI
jgi:hypothetical protein